MIFFVIGSCLLVMVVLFAFHWFPRASTWIALAYSLLVVGYAEPQLGPTLADTLCYIILFAMLALPAVWAIRAHRKRMGRF